MRMNLWQRLRVDTSGAVLMEYVMLGAVLLPMLVFGADALFDPAGAVTGNFGVLGNAFMDWYHRIIDTVALPVP